MHARQPMDKYCINQSESRQESETRTDKLEIEINLNRFHPKNMQ